MDVHLSIFLPRLENLSDRTLRRILRMVSKAAAKVTEDEVDQQIARSGLTAPEQQSLRDRLRPQLQVAPRFYFEAIRRGSILLSVVVSAAAWWVLDKTLGTSLGDAHRKSRFHQKLVAWLSAPISIRRRGSRKPGGSQSEPASRWNFLYAAYSSAFERGRVFDRLEVVDLKITASKAGDMLIRVTMELLPEHVDHVETRRLDVKVVLLEITRRASYS